ncbi:hypothetical protein GCM10009760_38230 [Kitasatospora kazusensis]|uniref:RNA polymerase sigma factor 70 region 4 type 2 domain-containing protein n=1 Tax=Kitasatospora kazusensis TaxID=407974 RepID=A0ABP5LND4_9ACTN
MTENDWAVRSANRPRLTFDAFCETHERAWTGIARARLHDEADVARTVEAMKADLWRNWAIALRQPVPACYAWMLIKERVADTLAEAALKTVRPAVEAAVPPWVELVGLFSGLARLGPAAPGDPADLYRAFLQLPERQYDVVVLRHLLGLKDAMIADYLGTTEANVRSTAGQAARRLTRKLDRHRDQGGTP